MIYFFTSIEMDAAKLTLTYQIFKTLYNYCSADTKWENLIDYIGNKCYTKTDKLKRNNWKIINVLRQNKLENYDDLNELVEFWNNNCHKYNYIKDEKGNVIFTTLKEQFATEENIVDDVQEENDYFDYLDYMNEVATQQQQADNAHRDEFENAAQQAYQNQPKIEAVVQVPVFANEIVPEQQYDLEQELEYCNQLKDHSIYENGVTFYINKNKKVRFSVLKNHIIQFLDSITDLDKWSFRYYIEAFGKGEWKTVPLNSDNIPRVKQFIDNSVHDNIDNLIQDFYNGLGEEARIINFSDQGETIGDIRVSFNMCSAVQITPKAFGNKRSQTEIYCDNGGAFYDCVIKEDYSYLEQFTKRYQVFSSLLVDNKPRSEFDLNCLLYAFKQSGQIDDKTLIAMKSRCFTRIVSFKQVCNLCDEFKIRLSIKKKDMKQNQLKPINNKKYIGCLEGYIATINLILIRKHYFLDEQVKGLSSFYLKNIDKVNQYCIEHNKPLEYGFTVTGFNNRGYPKNRTDVSVSSSELIDLMEQHNIVRKLTFSDRSIFQSDLHNYIKSDIEAINIHENDCRVIVPKNRTVEKHQVFYADCESDVMTNDIHKAFYIAWTERNSDNIQGAFGENCLEQFFQAIPNNSIVYFHNLGYDSRLMNKYNITQSIDKNSRVMSETITYKDKSIILKDSFSILSMPLAKFPKTFKLPCGEKEMFPYKYYTFE